jgi:predicted AlkP superfamily phosphohydrolase/phosphomutase
MSQELLSNKMIVVGLDGATYDLMDPLIKAGYLPNVRRIISNGFSATLRSTIPPVTAPAWLSMVTGLSPGNTGVFYFLNRKDENFDFIPLDSSEFADRSVWDYMDSAGMRSAIYNFPMLYPPYPLNNGYMVSGIGAPEKDTIVSLPEIYDILKQEYPDYKVHIPYSDRMYKNDPQKLLLDLKESLKKRFNIIFRLLERNDYDFFFGVVSETDWANHYFWGSFDPSYTGSSIVAKKADGALQEIWKIVDENLGKLVDEFGDHNEIFIVSDHGFGPANRIFYINQWLNQKGYLQLKKETPLDRLRWEISKKLTMHKQLIKKLLKTTGGGGITIKRVFDLDPKKQIDFEKSLIFATKHNFATGMLYLTQKGKTMSGQFLSELKQKLKEEGERLAVEIDIIDADDIYTGKYRNLAPDLIIKMDNYACQVSPFLYPYTKKKEVLEPSSFYRNISGSHREEGILLGYGHRIARTFGAKRGEYNIWDICPTLLYALGVAIPENLDGKVVKKIFKDQYKNGKTAPPTDQTTRKGKPISRELTDTEQVLKQLKGLGYL